MKLENQVCTLEQAKILKELGVSQNSMFGFIEIPSNGMGGVRAYWQDKGNALILTDIVLYAGNGKYKWSAFTVAELGVMLGNGFQVDCSTFPPTRGKYYVYGTVNDFDYYDTEAEARAAKLIESIKREFITVEEINARLTK